MYVPSPQVHRRRHAFDSPQPSEFPQSDSLPPLFSQLPGGQPHSFPSHLFIDGQLQWDADSPPLPASMLSSSAASPTSTHSTDVSASDSPAAAAERKKRKPTAELVLSDEPIPQGEVEVCDAILWETESNDAAASSVLEAMLHCWQKKRGGGFEVAKAHCRLGALLQRWFHAAWRVSAIARLQSTQCAPLRRILLYERLLSDYGGSKEARAEFLRRYRQKVAGEGHKQTKCRLCPKVLSKGSDFNYSVYHLACDHLQEVQDSLGSVERAVSSDGVSSPSSSSSSSASSSAPLLVRVESHVRHALAHPLGVSGPLSPSLEVPVRLLSTHLVLPYFQKQPMHAPVGHSQLVHKALLWHLQDKGNQFRQQLIQERVGHLPNQERASQPLRSSTTAGAAEEEGQSGQAMEALGVGFSRMRLESDPPSFVFDLHSLMKEYGESKVGGTEHSVMSLLDLVGFSALKDSLRTWKAFLDSIEGLVRFIRDPTHRPDSSLSLAFDALLTQTLDLHPGRAEPPSVTEQKEGERRSAASAMVDVEEGEAAQEEPSLLRRVIDITPYLRYILCRVLQVICSQHRPILEMSEDECRQRTAVEMQMIAVVVQRWKDVSGLRGVSIIAHPLKVTGVHLFYTAACNAKRELLTGLRAAYLAEYKECIDAKVESGWTALTTCIARAADRVHPQSGRYYDIAMDILQSIAQHKGAGTLTGSRTAWSPMSLALRIPEGQYGERTRLQLVNKLFEFEERGTFFKFATSSTNYPIHDAIRDRDLPLFQALLPKTTDKDLDTADVAGLTAIFLAANSGQVDMVRALLPRSNLFLLNDTFKSVTTRCKEMGEHAIASIIEDCIRKISASSRRLPVSTVWD